MRTPLAIALMTTLVAAGCVSGGDDLTAASTTDSSTLVAVLMEEPFTWDGSYTPGVGACPVVTCATVRLAGTYIDLDPQGDITALSLTMTWDAVAPNMEQLRFGITWDEDQVEFVEGPSPLLLELDGLNITKGEAPYVWTWPVTPVPQGVATLLTPQDFHVEGTLTQATMTKPADANEAAAATPAIVLTVAEQGAFGAGAFTCVPITCFGQDVMPSDRIFPQSDALGMVDVALVAEWTSETPATDQMALGIFACPDGCASDDDISAFEFAYGPSPLALDLTGFKVPEGEILFVYMQQGGTTIPVLYAQASVPQDFAIGGTLTLLPPSPAEAEGNAPSGGP